MPKYRYKCKSCGNKFEQSVNIDDRLNVKCAECGGGVGIIPSLSSVLYKAQGFASQELEKQRLDAMAEEATEEGFVSQTEMEVSIEQALTRADRKGIPPHRLVDKEILETGKVPTWEDSLAEVI